MRSCVDVGKKMCGAFSAADVVLSSADSNAAAAEPTESERKRLRVYRRKAAPV